VYFDPNIDTALVRVPGLSLTPLTIGDKFADGAAAKLIGYPDGNSQVISDGSVLRTFSAATTDIYDSVDVTRDLYEVSVAVNHGNSGGPLVDDQGVVHGMVFAKAPDKDATAYILLPDIINYVITQGASATEALTTKCVVD
jgi:S1-C subfamily serine protease